MKRGNIQDLHPTQDPENDNPVVWTRGDGCRELAELLSVSNPKRVVGELAEFCIRARADMLVSRRFSGFDLISRAVPQNLVPTNISTVVAAVAGGPHSLLAARVAKRIGASLGVEAGMISAYRAEEDRGRAITTIEAVYQQVKGLSHRVVSVTEVSDLLSVVPERTLWVLGAPGGNWFQRIIFGQGAKLAHRVAHGAVLVRQAPRRIFQHMGDPVFVGPLRLISDILLTHAESVLAVVDRAELIGLVRRERLLEAPAQSRVETVMLPPRSVGLTSELVEIDDLADEFGGSPIPVIDEDNRLVGSVYPPYH